MSYQRLCTRLLVVCCAALASGCAGDGTSGSSSVHGSVYYGVGWHDPYYYNDGWDNDAVVVPNPPNRPERPAQLPAAVPPRPTALPATRPVSRPSIPARPRPATAARRR